MQVLPLARYCRGGVQEEDIVVLCRRNMPWIRGTGRTGRCSSPEIEGQRRLLRSMSTRRIDPPQKQGVSNKKAAGEAIAIPFYLGVDTHRSTRCKRNDGARRAWRGFPSLLRCTSARCRRNEDAASSVWLAFSFSVVLCLDAVKMTAATSAHLPPRLRHTPTHDAGD